MGLAPASLAPDERDVESLTALRSRANSVALASKSPPLTLLGPVAAEGQVRFTVGTLSNVMAHEASGYVPLPDWSTSAPDPEIRDAPADAPTGTIEGFGSDSVKPGEDGMSSAFYGSDGSGGSSSDDESGSSDSDSSSSSSSSDSGSGSDDEDDDDSSDDDSEGEEESGSDDSDDSDSDDSGSGSSGSGSSDEADLLG
jgi:hypothetical protein